MGNAAGCLVDSNPEKPKGPHRRITDEGNSLKDKRVAAQGKKDEKETSNPVAQQLSNHENIGTTIVTKPFLPDEIIVEILTWLPAKSLARLKCVCKKYCGLTEDRSFINKHISRASTLQNKYNEQETPAVHPNPNIETFEFICGCDGLLVIKSNDSGRYLIRNPTILQNMDLPSPHEGSFSMILTFISATGSYKLVSFFYDKDKRNNECCEILTIEIGCSWRSLELPNILDEDKRRERISVVSVGEAVHCVRVIKVGASIFREEVVSLDLNTECFITTLIPKDLFSNWGSVWAINWNGHLAFADTAEDDLNVLVLENFKKHKWGERKKILSLAILTEKKEDLKDFVPIYCQCGNLWFWLKDRKLICYEIESGKIKQTIKPTKGYKISGTLYCCPQSLVRVKGMKPEN